MKAISRWIRSLLGGGGSREQIDTEPKRILLNRLESSRPVILSTLPKIKAAGSPKEQIDIEVSNPTLDRDMIARWAEYSITEWRVCAQSLRGIDRPPSQPFAFWIRSTFESALLQVHSCKESGWSNIWVEARVRYQMEEGTGLDEVITKWSLQMGNAPIQT